MGSTGSGTSASASGSHEMDIPTPQDIMAVLEMIESQRPEKTGRASAMTEGQRMLVTAGYDLVRRVMMYAYYCSLRDTYRTETKSKTP